MKTTKLKFLILISILIFCINPSYAKTIKIGLLITDKTVKVGSNEKANILNLYTEKPIGKLDRKEVCLVKNNNSVISIFNKTKNASLGSYSGPILISPVKKDSLVFCNGKWYRGELIILTNGDSKNITVVNNVDLEDYLLSVVPSEIPHKWNRESLKAQSVAARSYSLGYMGRRKEKGYDLESTVEDQMYLGVSAEKWSTTRAVKETKNQILLTNEGEPLIALYHSSGGGFTDSIENLWDEKPSPHIQPRPDYDDASPHFKWYRTFNITDLNKMLSSLNIGNILKITPLSLSISKRVTLLEIQGSEGKAQLRGEELRKLLKLPSSKFNIEKTNTNYRFAGRGYGHGLGLSQWGSKALAEKGFSYRHILAHYYTGG